MNTTIAVHSLNTAIQSVDLLTDGLHQPDHHSGDELLPDPPDLGVDTDAVVDNLLDVVPGPGGSHALGPVKLARVHVGLDDGMMGSHFNSLYASNSFWSRTLYMLILSEIALSILSWSKSVSLATIFGIILV